MTRRDWLLLFALTLLAAALRFYQLGVVPSGPQFDEAFNAIDADQVLHGNRPLFLPANGGREVVYTYLQAATSALLGLNLYTLRLASALAGTLTVPAVYLLVHRLFQRDDRWLALFTSLALAISYWHIHFSHYGIRVILMPLIFCGVFGAFWLGMHGASRRRRLSALVIGGALAGLAVWTHPTGRFVPFVVVPYALWLFWRYPERRRLRLDGPIGGTLLFGATALLVFLPLAIEFVRHPEFFFGHAAEVSVFAGRVSGEASPWTVLGTNILRVLGMFSFDGDLEWAHGIADRPVFDWFLALPFYAGVVLWVVRLAGKDRAQPDGDRDALALFALWAGVMLAPSILSEAAPNYSRSLPAIPAVMLAAGLGLTWLATQPRLKPFWGLALAGLLLVASAGITVYDYFVRFPSYREVYYVYDADKVDALDWLKAQSEDNTVYLAPLWTTHATVTILRDGKVKTLPPAQETLVLPPAGKGAIYAYPAEQAGDAEAMAARWGTEVERIDDRYGRPLLAVVRLDPATVARWPSDLAPEQAVTAQFDDAPFLIGMKPGEDGRDLWLYWQADRRTLRDLTSFVHLLDGRNNRVGQADRVPGDGFFPTPAWWLGERVAQRYTPEVTDLCAGGERVRVVTGWYEYAAGGQRRPRAGAAGDSALAGEVTLPFVSVPADRVQPLQAKVAPLDDHVQLVGFDPPAGPLEAGAPFEVALYLKGGDGDGEQPLSLALHGTAGSFPLWSGQLAPGANWTDGEIVCRRVAARAPAAIPPGEFTLSVAASGATVPLQTVQAVTSTRTFDLPPGGQLVDARLDEAVRLHTYGAVQSSHQLTVTLVWQSLAPTPAAQSVFVHLMDGNGAIVAQSDATPAGGYGVDRWVEGEVVVDTHRLELPPGLPAGEYRLAAGMYDPVTGQRLPVEDAAGVRSDTGAVDLGTVTITVAINGKEIQR